MVKHFLLSPESEELNDEQLDEYCLFEEISDADFSDLEEIKVYGARRETRFPRVWNQ